MKIKSLSISGKNAREWCCVPVSSTYYEAHDVLITNDFNFVHLVKGSGCQILPFKVTVFHL